MSLFNYKLKSVKQCAYPVGNGNRKSVAWFWMTDCEYYIQLGDVKLFESSHERWRKRPDWPQYLDYPFARFLEDFFDILPSVVSSIPPDIYSYIDTADKKESLRKRLNDWYSEIDEPTEEQEAIENNVTKLLWANKLDTGFLAFPARCWFYRKENIIQIQYDFRAVDDDDIPVWSAGCGGYEFSWQEFIGEVENLLNRFFRDMDKQVEDAIQLLRSSNDYIAYEARFSRDHNKYTIEAGIDYLIREHAQRKADFWNVLNAAKENKAIDPIEWDQIKTSAEFLLSLGG